MIGGPPFVDPTSLTTDAVDHAKAELRREMLGLREVIEARVLAVEQSADLRIQALRAMPADIANQITHLELLLMSRIESLERVHSGCFDAIAQQFAERDVRTEQDKKASKEALDAALLAQKESVGQQNEANTKANEKTETNTTKQIDQIGVLITTLEKSLTDRITELKERIDRGEGTGVGARDAQADQRADEGAHRQGQGIYLQVTSIVVSLVAILAVVFLALH
jgi:hypothetical protein